MACAIDMRQNKQIADYLVKKIEKKQAANGGFVWRKKIERNVMEGRVMEVKILFSKKRHTERLEEAKKLKKRKVERDIARAKWEEETSLLAWDRARAEDQEWMKKEGEFCLGQSRIRSQKRIREGRPKPIDLLIRLLDNDDDLEKDNQDHVVEPCMFFKGLDMKDLEELRDEIKLQVSLDNGTKVHIDYWDAALVVCEDFLNHGRVRGGSGIHRTIEGDVELFLEGKSNLELEDLESNIESIMRSGDAKVVEFWEVVLKRLSAYKSRAFLKEIYDRMLDSKELLEVANGDENGEVIDTTPNSEEGFEDKALARMERMEEGEEVFGSDQEINLEPNVFSPRKPKCFNVVHTGYWWNKYNRTHYDHDNPPPKTAMGYKFNILYPNLVDQSRVPTYFIEKDIDAASSETCIIRFHAGPPYEDIAFRICNKEWECSRKKGFKCTFDGGILRLHFKIKHYSYRR